MVVVACGGKHLCEHNVGMFPFYCKLYVETVGCLFIYMCMLFMFVVMGDCLVVMVFVWCCQLQTVLCVDDGIDLYDRP